MPTYLILLEHGSLIGLTPDGREVWELGGQLFTVSEHPLSSDSDSYTVKRYDGESVIANKS